MNEPVPPHRGNQRRGLCYFEGDTEAHASSSALPSDDTGRDTTNGSTDGGDDSASATRRDPSALSACRRAGVFLADGVALVAAGTAEKVSRLGQCIAGVLKMVDQLTGVVRIAHPSAIIMFVDGCYPGNDGFRYQTRRD